MLGDAIHPMAPFKGQVLSQNAFVLLLETHSLDGLGDPGKCFTLTTNVYVQYREQIKHCLMVFFSPTNFDDPVRTTKHCGRNEL